MRALCSGIFVSILLLIPSAPVVIADSRYFGSSNGFLFDGAVNACGEFENYWHMDSISFVNPPTVFQKRSSCGSEQFVHSSDHWYRQPAIASAERPKTEDSVPSELTALGAEGPVIERARLAVLRILEGGNSCTAWLEEKDSRAASLFRGIHFRIDEDGPKFAMKKQDRAGAWSFREPYAAKVFQRAEPPVWITLNSGGAFFRSSAALRYVYDDNTPAGIISSQRLHIETYQGSSLGAQIVILLHELAHVLDAIPPDAGPDTSPGLSSRNTEQVLHHCRAQVETAVRHR